MLQSNSLQVNLDKYAQVFNELTLANLNSSLTPLLSNKVIFKDPFNEVIGIDSIIKIFKQMFLNLEEPKFIILHTAIKNNTGYIHWYFKFKFKSESQVRNIEGLSQIRFNASGLIDRHIDYWDTAENIYQHIPLLGWFIRKISKKLQVTE